MVTVKTIKLTDHNVEAAVTAAAEFLQEGGVVMLPTDTSYGLAADAANADAVRRIFELKGRPPTQAMSVVVPDRSSAEALGVFSPAAAKLWDRFMPGPLTLVLPVAQQTGLAEQVTDKGKTIGIRCPKKDLSILVAERFGRPFTATSANRSGQPPAYSPEEFLNSLPDDESLHLVIDAGELPINSVSTVVKVTDRVLVLREGAIPAAVIMEAAGEPQS